MLALSISNLRIAPLDLYLLAVRIPHRRTLEEFAAAILVEDFQTFTLRLVEESHASGGIDKSTINQP